MVHTKLAATGVEISVGTVAAIMAERVGCQADARLQTHDHPLGPGQGFRRPHRQGLHLSAPGHELHPWPVGGEIPVDQVRHARGRLSVSFGGDAERAWLTGHLARLAHNLPHQLGRALGLFRGEIAWMRR
jgi:hypothetical protein